MFVLTMSKFREVKVKDIRRHLRRGEEIVLVDSDHIPYAVIKPCENGEEFDLALNHKPTSFDDVRRLSFG